LKSLTQKTKIWHNNALTRRFGRYSFTIFGLKMMVKSGVEKIFLKYLNAQAIFKQLFLLHGKEDFCTKLQI
jgi:hypothetical protein